MTPVPTQRRAKLVHVVRIRPFANGPLGDKVNVNRLSKAAQRDFPDNVVKRFVRHRLGSEGNMQLLVRWLGFSEGFDTWEPVETLVEDVPDMVEAYLRKNETVPVCASMLKRYYA